MAPFAENCAHSSASGVLLVGNVTAGNRIVVVVAVDQMQQVQSHIPKPVDEVDHRNCKRAVEDPRMLTVDRAGGMAPVPLQNVVVANTGESVLEQVLVAY